MFAMHYMYDALCAWCYGIDPHLRQLEKQRQVEIILHGAGMYPLPKPFPDPDGGPIANYLAEAKQRHPQVERDTGLPITDRFDGAFRGVDAIDSRPSIAGVLAAEKLQGDGLGMLRELQRSLFAHGEPILDQKGVTRAAARQGIRPDAFAKAYDAVWESELDGHMRESRELLEKVEGSGYPTLAFERDGSMRTVEIERYDDPRGWAAQFGDGRAGS